MQQSIRHSYVIILYPQPWQKITAKDQTAGKIYFPENYKNKNICTAQSEKIFNNDLILEIFPDYQTQVTKLNLVSAVMTVVILIKSIINNIS